MHYKVKKCLGIHPSNTPRTSGKYSSTASVASNHSNIKLTKEQFDNFKKDCMNPSPIPNKLKEAAKLLDDEGF